MNNMNKLSEDEIIARVQNLIDYINFKPDRKYNTHFAIIAFPDEQWFQAIQSLLDLYQQEKEKNKELKEMLERRINYTSKLEKDLFENCSNYVVNKGKIREKIEELEGQEDWYIENKSLDDLYGRIDELKELLEEE